MRQRIFVNGLNAKTGGGKSILTNLLSLLSKNSMGKEFYVLVPDLSEYEDYKSEALRILGLSPVWVKNALFPLVNQIILPSMVKKLNCQIVFNLSDVPMPTKARQVFLFDWPYAVFPNSPVWKMMDFNSWIVRKSKLFFFKKYLKYVDLTIAQTPVMKMRLEKYYDLQNIEVVPNAVSVDSLRDESLTFHNFGLKDGVNLLYLTYYYTHKNIEILIPLAKKILSQGEPVNIITTISSEQHPMADRFLNEIQNQGLGKVINNIGPVSMKDVPALYNQVDGLLMPTLLESFSGCYVEAMFHNRPIFTSDLDFAKSVCGEAAYYFDPLNPQQIFEKIMEWKYDPKRGMEKIHAGQRILKEFMTWEKVLNRYMQLFDKVIYG